MHRNKVRHFVSNLVNALGRQAQKDNVHTYIRTWSWTLTDFSKAQNQSKIHTPGRRAHFESYKVGTLDYFFLVHVRGTVKTVVMYTTRL